MSLPAIRFSSRRVERLALRALQGQLRPAARRRLRQHLERLERDRQAYDQLAQLMAALEGDSLLCAGQRESIFAAALPREARTRVPHAPLLARSLAAAAVLLLAAGLLLWASGPGDQLTPRGQRLVGTPGGGLALSAVCFRDGQAVATPPAESGAQAHCRLQDELQLVLTQPGRYRQLLVVGLQGGQRRWYFPVPPTGSSAPLSGAMDAEPLGEAVRLAVNHAPGPLRIIAVLSRRRIAADELFQRAEELPASELASALARSMGGPQQVQVLELRVMISGAAP